MHFVYLTKNSSEPISGNHPDLYDIEIHFEETTSNLE